MVYLDVGKGISMLWTNCAMKRVLSLRNLVALVLAAVVVLRFSAAHANDDLCASPSVIAAAPFSETRDTTTATSDPTTDPIISCAGNSRGSNSVWYSFTPDVSGNVTAFTDGSNYDTVLAVYTGACGALSQTVCNDDAPGVQTSHVTFAVSAGTTYLIEVVGYANSGGGMLTIGLTAVVRAAENDDCTAPTAIATVPFEETSEASKATTSASDPLQSCGADGPDRNQKSVWYSFTSASDGVVTASTVASSYDTIVTAYTGTCGALTEIACNDDANGELQSAVSFPVTGGTSYLLEVTAYYAPAETVLHFTLDFAPPAATAKAADKCQKAIKKAGLTFVTKKLASLGKCANKVFTCIQTKPNEKRDACVQKASGKCMGELGKIANEETKLEGKILKACNENLVSFANLTGSTGLGYAEVIGECESEFGMSGVDTAAEVAACVALQHECRTEELLEVEAPRARELIQVTLGGQMIPLGLDCLTDHGGSGLDVENEATGKAIAKCQATITKAAAKFVKTKLTSLEKCVDALFTCRQKAPTDARCRAKAQGTCDKAFAKIDGARLKLDLAVDKKCLPPAVDYAMLRAADAAYIDALETECPVYGVPTLESIGDYKECLFQQHACKAEELLRFAAPRAESLLELAGRPLWSEFCPLL